MATAHDIAKTVGEAQKELCDRIDLLLASKDITSGAATSLQGIAEWLGSIQQALMECNGVPTPTMAERCRAWEAARAAGASEAT